MTLRSVLAAAVIAVVLPLSLADAANNTERRAVVETYSNMARAAYEDSLVTAENLDAAIKTMLAAPSEITFKATRKAWIAARVPYQQTEVYRFGNAIVDDWEGRVNAWPLDEGLIDYVDSSYGQASDENKFYTANIIANEKLRVGGRDVDAALINTDLLRSLHEIDNVEANVSTGYHAIEFLLWGQDLNGTGPGAGKRPWSDFAVGQECTGGHCDRRRAYLETVSALLLLDLKEMVANWQDDGAARKALADASPDQGLAAMLTGMGSLSYGELAGERIKLGLLLHDPEEEHDCFSDNTHNSHYYNALGIQNIYLGRYERVHGPRVTGSSLAALVAKKSPELDAEMRRKLDITIAAFQTIREAAQTGEMSYDQMIGEGNEEGNAMVQAAIDALLEQTKTIERIAALLNLQPLALEGSNSLDNPSAVFQ